MKKWLLLIAVLASKSPALPDLVAPFDIRLINSSAFFDTLEIRSYLLNKGTTTAFSPLYPEDYPVLTVGVDSFNIRGHDMVSLSAGYYREFVDTIVVIQGPGSIHSWCDLLRAWDEGAGQINNNVRSQAFNFHPKIIRDTVVLYDTLVIRDTLKIVEKDTVIITLKDTIRVTVRDTIIKKDTIRVTIRDTVIRVDTVKYCPPTLAKAGRFGRGPAVASVVYNAVGQPVWRGSLPVGEYPPVRLKQGLHLLVQGQRAHRFRVAYK